MGLFKLKKEVNDRLTKILTITTFIFILILVLSIFYEQHTHSLLRTPSLIVIALFFDLYFILDGLLLYQNRSGYSIFPFSGLMVLLRKGGLKMRTHGIYYYVEGEDAKAVGRSSVAFGLAIPMMLFMMWISTRVII